MINQQLLGYIKQQLQRGFNREKIKNSLIAKGWQESDIDEAFASLTRSSEISSQLFISQATLTSLPGAFAILKQALVLYKQRLEIFLGVMLGPILIQITIIIIASRLVDIVIRRGGILEFKPFSFRFSENEMIVLEIIFFLIFFLSQTWMQTALLYAIKDSQEGISVIEAYRKGWGKIASYLWTSFLMGLITMGGFLFFILPGIIFAIWFSLTKFVLIAEDFKGMDAIVKSYEYVRGKFGSVFWRFFFISVLYFIAALIFIITFALLKISFISGPIIELFFTPLLTIYSFLVYRNLKNIKGEIVFTPTGKRKAFFIFIAIVGILVIPIILFIYNFLKF